MHDPHPGEKKWYHGTELVFLIEGGLFFVGTSTEFCVWITGSL